MEEYINNKIKKFDEKITELVYLQLEMHNDIFAKYGEAGLTALHQQLEEKCLEEVYNAVADVDE